MRTLPDPRLGLALAAAKVTSFGMRRSGRGGTAAPGLVADRLDSRLLTKLSARLPRGAVVVAGTNGKTTISRMLADILETDGAQVIHNRSGSNLVRGVVAAFASQATLTGDPRGEIGVIEADEAAFPEIVRRVQPRVVLLNNLFRDQLDRYGELHTIAQKWRPALEALPADATIVANVDDPLLATVTEGLRARVVAFGLDDPNPALHLDALPHAADTATCRQCGTRLTYGALYLGHLGDWRCPGCGLARPDLTVAGQDIQLHGAESLDLSITPSDTTLASFSATVGVPGLYNAYNALAAAAVALALDVNPSTITRGLANFRAAFGRLERATLNGRALTLALIKNPTGCNEVLRMMTSGEALSAQRSALSNEPSVGAPLAAPIAEGEDSAHGTRHSVLSTQHSAPSTPTLIAINDLDADGRDVSWLWDVDFELLAGGEAPLYTAGIRGADMANRLKYAGVPVARIHHLPGDLPTALDTFAAALPADGRGYILPTYTAMLTLRRALANRGAVAHFWEQ